MELIYLWIEKYKNIEKEGFNFSPRFECKFDGKNLTIKENKDYESVFPENINVTAVIGKNGSGKSSVLELLIEFFNEFFNNLPNEKYSGTLQTNIELIKHSFHNKNIFCVFKFKEQIYYIGKKDVRVNIENIKKIYLDHNIKTDLLDTIKQDLLLLHYDYSFSKFRVFKKDLSIGGYSPSSFTNKISLYEDNDFILCIPKKTGYHSGKNIFNNTDYDKVQIIKYLIKKDINKIFNYKSFFEPYKVYVEYRILDYNYKEQIKNEKNAIYKLKLIVLSMLSSLIIRKKKNIEINEIGIEKKEQILDLLKQHPNELTEAKKAYTFLELLENRKNINIFKIIQQDNKSDFFEVFIDKVNEKNIDLLVELPIKCFSITIIDKNEKEYDELSNGEKSALRIRFYIENTILSKNKSNFIVMLDEASNDMHPEWQRRLLNFFIKIFKDYKKQLHFIITTHSPFILSDIPKDNIIFLKDGKNVSDEVNIDTFGANIHTLLSHGFFMEDGLMGEFSKEKINEVIKFLNGKDSEIKSKEEAQNIINMIGEPIIKNQLQKMLDSKILDKIDKIDKIDELEEEVERLQQELKDLKNDKN